ncbi:MAG TPA: methyltransferase domain-containing protein [Allosphingosinicella sp.]|jgi:SAM-dependent methyltransferase
MERSDTEFAGAIPQLYDRCLGPFLFEPYAQDIAARASALGPARILETAAGTGIVTAALAAALPEAEIVATDLNPAMLEVAAARMASGRVSFGAADAQDLPFPDGGFDLVVCQFGAMFFPDRPLAYREARRVLRPGGILLFNVWDRLEANPAAAAVAEAVAAVFPDDPPSFLSRTPYGYHDAARIAADLAAAGFADAAIETVAKRSRGRASDVAPGLCEGSPLRAEIERRAPARLAEATAAALARLREAAGGDEIDLPMSALVVTASAAA